MTIVYQRIGSGPKRWSRRIWYTVCAESWKCVARVPRAVSALEKALSNGPLTVAFDTETKTAKVRL